MMTAWYHSVCRCLICFTGDGFIEVSIIFICLHDASGLLIGASKSNVCSLVSSVFMCYLKCKLYDVILLYKLSIVY